MAPSITSRKLKTKAISSSAKLSTISSGAGSQRSMLGPVVRRAEIAHRLDQGGNALHRRVLQDAVAEIEDVPGTGAVVGQHAGHQLAHLVRPGEQRGRI